MAKNTLIGLDIGTQAVKGIELACSKGKVKMLSAAVEKLPRGYNKEILISSIRKLLSDLKISHNKVNISISGKGVLVRYLVFPIMPKSGIIKSLKFEFDKYIPFSLEDSIVDIDILSKTADNKNLNVLIVAARRNVVMEKLSILEEIGLIPNLITTDSLALTKVFMESPYNDKKSSFTLVDIGAVATNLSIVNRNMPVFSRDVIIGGENFTQVISDKTGLSMDAAEEEKYNLPAEKLDMFSDLHSIVTEIELSIEYAKKTYSIDDMGGIYISGGGAKLSGLAQFIENSLGVKTSCWNPFANWGKPQEAQVIEDHYQDLVLSAGIALS